MEFSVVLALIAGFVATIVMSMLMAMARGMNMTEMPGMPLFTGSMMSPNPNTARIMGLVIHYLMMGTIVFGLIYAWLFSVLGSGGWLTGGLIGLIHGVAFGLMMPMMAMVHPRVSRQPGTVGAPAVRLDGEGVEISNPGMFGVNWGGMTPAGVVVAHAVYGLVLGLVYSALV